MAFFIVYNTGQPTSNGYYKVDRWGKCPANHVALQAIDADEVAVSIAAIPDMGSLGNVASVTYNPSLDNLLVGNEAIEDVSAPITNPGSTNLAVGGNFTSVNQPFDLSAGSASLSTAQSKVGVQSLLLSAGSGVRTYPMKADVEADEGDKFEVSVWVRRGSSFDGTSGNSKLRFAAADGTLIAALPYGASDIAASTWIRLKATVTVPANTPRVSFQLVADHTAGSLWVDNVVIRRKAKSDDLEDEVITQPKLGKKAVGGTNLSNPDLHNLLTDGACFDPASDFWRVMIGVPVFESAAGTGTPAQTRLTFPADGAQHQIRTQEGWAGVDVEGSEEFLFSFSYAGGGNSPRDRDISVTAHFSTDSGAYIAPRTVTVTVVDDLTWRVMKGSFTAPGTAAKLYAVVVDSPAGKSASGRITQLRLHRKNAAQLVVDGGIKAQHLDTVTLGVSGLAVFGGAVKSDDFVTGVSGWRISKTGTAEFQKLIDRSAFTPFALTDYTIKAITAPMRAVNGVQTNEPGAAGPAALYNSATYGLVPTPLIWCAFFRGRARTNAGSLVNIEIQSRTKQDGAWDEWRNEKTYTFGTTDPVLKSYSVGGIIAHYFEGFEIRLRATCNWPDSNWTIVSNTYVAYQQVHV